MKCMCLQDELLADYLEDRIDAEERSDIETHLSECPRCLDDFLTANGMPQNRVDSAADPVPEHVTESAVELVTKLVLQRHQRNAPESDSLFSRVCAGLVAHLKWIISDKNRYAHVRGSGKAEAGGLYSLRKTFNGITTDIEIQKTGDQIAVIRITMVEGFDNPTECRVTLRDNQREIASHRTSGGFMIFENIPFGLYSLDFMQNGKKMGTYRFEVKESS